MLVTNAFKMFVVITYVDTFYVDDKAVQKQEIVALLESAGNLFFSKFFLCYKIFNISFLFESFFMNESLIFCQQGFPRSNPYNVVQQGEVMQFSLMRYCFTKNVFNKKIFV